MLPKECMLELLTIGFSTVESIPLYHFSPGGSSLRLILKPRMKKPFKCDYCYLGELNKNPDAYTVACIEFAEIAKLIKRWNIDTLLLDGVEPLEASCAIDFLRYIKAEFGVYVGFRSQGLISMSREFVEGALNNTDYVVFDYIVDGYEDAVSRLSVVSWLEYFTSKTGLHVEVVVHMKTQETHPLIPLMTAIKDPTIPLHIVVYAPSGVGAKPLLDFARRKFMYVYVHAGPYSVLDTRCPHCNAYIAVREEGVLLRLELEGGKCPKCGKPIPFRGQLHKETPRRLRLETRGETIWHHIQALPLKMKSC